MFIDVKLLESITDINDVSYTVAICVQFPNFTIPKWKAHSASAVFKDQFNKIYKS